MSQRGSVEIWGECGEENRSDNKKGVAKGV